MNVCFLCVCVIVLMTCILIYLQTKLMLHRYDILNIKIYDLGNTLKECDTYNIDQFGTFEKLHEAELNDYL
jgi:hypothetical protein